MLQYCDINDNLANRINMFDDLIKCDDKQKYKLTATIMTFYGNNNFDVTET